MKLKIAILGLAGVIVFAGKFLKDPTMLGFCFEHYVPGGSFCAAPLAVITDRFLPFAIVFMAIAAIATLVIRSSYRLWLSFSIGYGFLSVILMFLASKAGIDDGGFVSLPLFDIEAVAWWLAGLYGILSLLILIISDLWVRLAKK